MSGYCNDKHGVSRFMIFGAEARATVTRVRQDGSWINGVHDQLEKRLPKNRYTGTYTVGFTHM